jgi:hemoglobin
MSDVTRSIYEQIGGEPSVDAAVDLFYRKVLVDNRISRFFDDVDMDRQAAKQKAFLTMVLGGPARYTGLDMRRGHLHLIARGLDDEHVDAVIELLGETLAELGVPAATIAQIAAVAESARDDVLDRPKGSTRGTKPGSSSTAPAPEPATLI